MYYTPKINGVLSLTKYKRLGNAINYIRLKASLGYYVEIVDSNGCIYDKYGCRKNYKK